jgi:hypothetical protein
MTAFFELQGAWQAVEQRFMASQPIQRLGRGDLTLAHYASYLRETYFYTRENPRIQGLCTAWFRSELPVRAMTRFSRCKRLEHSFLYTKKSCSFFEQPSLKYFCMIQKGASDEK